MPLQLHLDCRERYTGDFQLSTPKMAHRASRGEHHRMDGAGGPGGRAGLAAMRSSTEKRWNEVGWAGWRMIEVLTVWTWKRPED